MEKEPTVAIKPTIVINNYLIRYNLDDASLLGYYEYDIYSSLYSENGWSVEEREKVTAYLFPPCDETCRFFICRTHSAKEYMTSEDIINMYEELFPYRVQDVKMVLNRIESLKEFLKAKEYNEAAQRY